MRDTHVWSPPGGECDEPDGEEESRKGLDWAADGEDRTADAGAAAKGQQGKQVGDHLKILNHLL